MRARQKRLFAKTLGLSQVCPWQTSDRLSDQVQVWNAHLSNFELVDIRIRPQSGRNGWMWQLLLPCVGRHSAGYPGFCSPWAGGVMPACGLRLARLHPPLAGCHLCSAGLTATTAGLRMPPWARARHQSHRHQQGWSRGWTTRQTSSPPLQTGRLLGRGSRGGKGRMGRRMGGW